MKKGFTPAEGATHADMFKGSHKNAFTLAEVLITLGIIGVVAAMTLPAVIQNYRKIDSWFSKYLSSFIVLKRKSDKDGRLLYYLSDGTAFQLGTQGNASLRDIYFYPGNPERCQLDKYDTLRGVCVFNFEYYPVSTSAGWKYHYNKGLEPAKYKWDGTVNKLLNDNERGCTTDFGVYCTALIQSNGWKIPKNYPKKVRY